MGIRHRSIFVDKATSGNIFPVTSDQYHEFRHLLFLLLSSLWTLFNHAERHPEKHSAIVSLGRTRTPRQNNLDKRAPIGYNAPISRARLVVNIMLTIIKHLDRIHQYTEPSYHVKVCFS